MNEWNHENTGDSFNGEFDPQKLPEDTDRE